MANKKGNNTNDETYYVWVGGSCDYGRKERAGGGAYIVEQNGKETGRYVTSDLGTTEFKMMLTVMIHAMETLDANSTIVFMTNVSYLQNFDKTPNEKTANADLIAQCIATKERHLSVSLKIVSYHKYAQLPETHEMAHKAMLGRR